MVKFDWIRLGRLTLAQTKFNVPILYHVPNAMKDSSLIKVVTFGKRHNSTFD